MSMPDNSKDLRNDIKGQRLSHISSPINNDAEFHLRKDEIGEVKLKIKSFYYVCFPVMCVSDNEKGKTTSGEDVDMARFIQMGVAKVVPDSSHPQDTNKRLKGIAKSDFGAKP